MSLLPVANGFRALVRSVPGTHMLVRLAIYIIFTSALKTHSRYFPDQAWNEPLICLDAAVFPPFSPPIFAASFVKETRIGSQAKSLSYPAPATPVLQFVWLP